MTTKTGKDGVLQIAANGVATMSSWTIEQTAEPAEDSVIGSDWRTFKPSMKGFSVSVEGFYNVDDVGQMGMAIGVQDTFTLHPGGNVSGEKEYTGAVIFTAYSETAAFDGMVGFSATMQGTGALTETLVA